MEWWQRDRPGVLDPARHLLNQTWGAHPTPALLPTKEIIAAADGYQLRYLMWWDEREVSRVWWLMDLGWSHPAAGDQGADCFSGQGAAARCWGAQFTGLTHTGIYLHTTFDCALWSRVAVWLQVSQKVMRKKTLSPLSGSQTPAWSVYHFVFLWNFILS